MSFEVKLHEDAIARLPEKPPQELVDGLDSAFEQLSADFKACSRLAPPPLLAIGRVHNFYFDKDDTRHYVTLHFVVDIPTQSIGIRKVFISPKYPPSSEPFAPSSSELTGEVVDIPSQGDLTD